jgi:regulator of protease activity HflC (stomatin/prohibitin superfamily)
VRQIDVETATKTRDNVQITVCTAIQFKVEEDKVSEFKFRLSNPNRQLESYVHDS